jgi:hypothetical protein
VNRTAFRRHWIFPGVDGAYLSLAAEPCSRCSSLCPGPHTEARCAMRNVTEDDRASAPSQDVGYPKTNSYYATFWSIDTESLLRIRMILHAFRYTLNPSPGLVPHEPPVNGVITRSMMPQPSTLANPARTGWQKEPSSRKAILLNFRPIGKESLPNYRYIRHRDYSRLQRYRQTPTFLGIL